MNKITKILVLALNLTLFSAVTIAPTILTTGCATLSDPEQFASALLDARDIAEAGTVAALIESESYRDALTKTRDALRDIQKLTDGTLTPQMLVEALAKLPIDQLQSDSGRIYVALGKIVLRRAFSFKTVDLGQTDKIKQIASALEQGMTEGLAFVNKPK